MTRFIIGTIAGLDNLTTPSQRGDIAFSNHFRKITAADLQKERDEVLATTAADIREMAGFIDSILSRDVICVFGNSDIIKANSKVFGKLITLEK
jgi:Zn-dependent M16 (insulinase) family peptidase